MSTRLHNITHRDQIVPGKRITQHLAHRRFYSTYFQKKQNVYFQQASPLPEELRSWSFLINDDPTPLELSLPPT